MADSREAVGVIGLGLIGSALCERFLAKGLQVVGYDLEDAKREALGQAGGKCAGSAGELLAECHRTFFCVMTTEQVAAVLDQNAGATRRGALVVDCTTGSPERVEALGRALADRRVDYVDATIAGSSAEVRLGEGIVMAGGSEAAYRRCTDLFASFARRAFHLGPCGAGSRMKLAYNLVLGLNRAALAEALAFAEALGVDPATALEVMREGPAYSRAMDVKGRKMLARDYEPQARLAQHRKDVGLMLEAAARCGARVPFTRVHADLLQSLIDMGLGDLDNSAIIEAFRR